MYDKILRGIKLRHERQQSSIRDTKKYLEAIEALPEVSQKTIGAVRSKLARQQEALRVTESELASARQLVEDPAQQNLEDEINKNEKEAASKIVPGRRR